MFYKYFVIFCHLFLSVGIQAKDTGQETLAQLIISMAREGKTTRGVLNLLKNNIPLSEYKNTLKFLENGKIDLDRPYPKLVLRENKIFFKDEFLIYVKSQNHIIIGSGKLNIKAGSSFSLDKKLSVLLGENENAFYFKLLFPEAEAVVVAAPLLPYITVLGAASLRVASIVSRHGGTALKFAMANVGLGAGPIKVLASTVVGVKVFRMFKTKYDLDGSFTCSEDGDWIFRTLPNTEGPIDYTNQLWNPHDSATRRIFKPEEFYNEIMEYDKELARKLSYRVRGRIQKSIRCNARTLKKMRTFIEEDPSHERESFEVEDAMA